MSSGWVVGLFTGVSSLTSGLSSGSRSFFSFSVFSAVSSADFSSTRFFSLMLYISAANYVTFFDDSFNSIGARAIAFWTPLFKCFFFNNRLWLCSFFSSLSLAGRSFVRRVRLFGLVFCFSGRKVIRKLNSERNFAYRACRLLRFFDVIKYFKFWWSVRILIGHFTGVPAHSGRYFSNARTIARSSLSYIS